MTRTFLSSLVIVVLMGSVAEAGHRRDRHCVPRDPPRFPRLQAIIVAYQRTPSTLPNRPSGSVALDLTFTGFSYWGTASLQTVAMGAPQAIRLGRVLLLGTPTPGHPLDTLLWVTSPTLLFARNALRELRRLR